MDIEPEDRWSSLEGKTMSILDDSDGSVDCCCSLNRRFSGAALPEGNFGVS